MATNFPSSMDVETGKDDSRKALLNRGGFDAATCHLGLAG